VIAEASVAARAQRAGLSLPPDTVAALAAHARAVLAANARLHLTALTDAEAFVERHLGESLEGAALLSPDVGGILVDVGSGNGYPGVPLGLARPGLRVVLAEAARKKADFLRQVATSLPEGRFTVLHAQVQRPEDLGELEPAILASRAMGNWERVLPRLARALPAEGTGPALGRRRGRRRSSGGMPGGGCASGAAIPWPAGSGRGSGIWKRRRPFRRRKRRTDNL
jgi:16S rRNA (guanine(527)-N(7))-methyltransferase RsmG